MSTIYLKVKIKSLAEEAKIIRKEEQKALKGARWFRRTNNDPDAYCRSTNLYNELRIHRKHPVGTEARAALIAYGYLRGRPYSKIETPSEERQFRLSKWNDKNGQPFYVYTIPNRAYTLINKYGGKTISFEEFEAWLNT